LMLLFIFPLISSASFEYDIYENKVLVQIELSQKEIQFFEFPEKYEINEEKIKYFDKGLIEKNSWEYFFISMEELHKNSSIRIILPEGYNLNKNYFIFPKKYTLSTDGERMVIEFENSGEKEILIPYKSNQKLFWVYILVGFFIISISLFYFLKKNEREKKYTKNLLKEEKQIMNYLVKKKECWTKEIFRDLKIPKVRLSRKIRNLEEKGLIDKIPYGNENKLKLKK
jgi:uncharacterized membrane protein